MNIEKIHQVFEKQVKRLEAALSPDMQTGAYIKGMYVSDYNRFKNMTEEKTIPGHTIKNSELDYLKERTFEINDLLETIKKDQDRLIKKEGLHIGPHIVFIERLEILKHKIGKAILLFPAMSTTLLFVWSLLQDDVKTAQKKFDSIRETIEDLLIESNAITEDKLNQARDDNKSN